MFVLCFFESKRAVLWKDSEENRKSCFIWNIKASHLTWASSMSSKQHSYFPALDLYTNSPRSSKGRSESFCSCPTSVGSLTLAATCWDRKLHLSCRSIASALSTLYFVSAAMSAKQAWNQRALNWQLFFCTWKRVDGLHPLLWFGCLWSNKGGGREREEGRMSWYTRSSPTSSYTWLWESMGGWVKSYRKKRYNLDPWKEWSHLLLKLGLKTWFRIFSRTNKTKISDFWHLAGLQAHKL